MDSRDKLCKRKPLPIPKDSLGRPFTIPKDKLDLLLKLPVDWSQTYKKFAQTICLQYPIAIGFCMMLFYFGETETFKTEIVEISHPKFVAIAYAELVLFTSFVSLLLLNEQTHTNLRFWRKDRNLENITIVYEDWSRLQFKTEIQYAYPSMGCETLGLMLISFLPYLVAGMIIGNKRTLMLLIVAGVYAASGIATMLYPLTLAFDKEILRRLTCEDQLV